MESFVAFTSKFLLSQSFDTREFDVIGVMKDDFFAENAFLWAGVLYMITTYEQYD